MSAKKNPIMKNKNDITQINVCIGLIKRLIPRQKIDNIKKINNGGLKRTTPNKN
jgi:hypothetical protein